MKILGNIRDTETYSKFIEWLNVLQLSQEVKSTYAPNREEKWFMKGSNLRSIDQGRAEIIEFSEPPAFVIDLGRANYPTFNSILVCKGFKPITDTTINWHRDHGHFEGKAVMLNLGRAEYSEKLYNGETDVRVIEDGDVVEIDTKLIHRSIQLSEKRFNITYRKVKTEHSATKLF